MKEPKQSVDTVSIPPGRSNVWWRVRPMLQVFLWAAVIALVALFNADATSATLLRAWFRPMAFVFEQLGWEHVQITITVMAVVAVVGVFVEASRTSRLVLRRSSDELKTASV